MEACDCARAICSRTGHLYGHCLIIGRGVHRALTHPDMSMSLEVCSYLVRNAVYQSQAYMG